DLSAENAKVDRLRREFDVADSDLVSSSYSDLLLDSPQTLLAAADAAMRNAHAPYSEFAVGAALRSASGAIYAGANFENAAYPLGMGAGAWAMGGMAAGGETKIRETAIVGERVDHCPPCGGCRQRLSEFAARDTPVHLGRPGGAVTTVTLG